MRIDPYMDAVFINHFLTARCQKADIEISGFDQPYVVDDFGEEDDFSDEDDDFDYEDADLEYADFDE